MIRWQHLEAPLCSRPLQEILLALQDFEVGPKSTAIRSWCRIIDSIVTVGSCGDGVVHLVAELHNLRSDLLAERRLPMEMSSHGPAGTLDPDMSHQIHVVNIVQHEL